MKLLAPLLLTVFVPGPTSVSSGSLGRTAWYTAVRSYEKIQLLGPTKASYAVRTGDVLGVAPRSCCRCEWRRRPRSRTTRPWSASRWRRAARRGIANQVRLAPSARVATGHEDEPAHLAGDQVPAAEWAHGVGGRVEQVGQVLRVADADHDHTAVGLRGERAPVDIDGRPGAGVEGAGERAHGVAKSGEFACVPLLGESVPIGTLPAP